MSFVTLAIVTLLQAAPAVEVAPRLWEGPDLTYDRRPKPEFPQTARVNRATVTLACTVGARGRVDDCTITSDSAPGQGFGQAAMRAMATARLATGDEAPNPGDRMRATIAFWDGT